MKKELINLLFTYKEQLLNKDWIIDLFSKSVLLTLDDLPSNPSIYEVYEGKLLLVDDFVHYVSEITDDLKVSDTIKLFKYNEDDTPFLSMQDTIDVPAKTLSNLSHDVSTTVGRYLLNYILLEHPFGDKIPFINDKFDLAQLETIISKKFLDDELTISQIDRFLKNEFFLSNYSEFTAPSLSIASITVDQKVIDLRDTLFEKYKDKLDDPEVMIEIEQKLIELDKEILSKDPDKGFLISGKNFTTHRKRMFLTMGILPAFGDDKPFNFAASNLNEGWSKEDLPVLFNDIRNGSYSRGKETAKGGTETKYLGRAFQETKIVEDDCKTTLGFDVVLTDGLLDENNTSNFMYRYCIYKGTTIEITDKTKDKLLNKRVIVRSPQFCQSSNGFCYKCMDTRFKKLNIVRLNTLAISIGSTFLQNSMKKMHGSKVDLLDVSVELINDTSFE
jgi:hypothetical protein